MNFDEITKLQNSLRVLQNMTLPSQQVMQMAHSAHAMSELTKTPALEAMQSLQSPFINSAKAVTEINPRLYETYVNIAQMHADISPITSEIAANTAKMYADLEPVGSELIANVAKMYADLSPVTSEIVANTAKMYADLKPVGSELIANVAKMYADLSPMASKVIADTVKMYADTTTTFLSEIQKNENLLLSISQKISLDFNFFNEAGLFPDSHTLPYFKEASHQSKFKNQSNDYIQEDDSINSLKNQSEKIDPDFTEIIQCTESLSETPKISKHAKNKKSFKRKISVRKAQLLCQKYKTHQIRYLYKELHSFALSKLDKENLKLFLGIISSILALPLPDNIKWYFGLFTIPFWCRLIYLTNFSDISHENKNRK